MSSPNLTRRLMRRDRRDTIRSLSRVVSRIPSATARLLALATLDQLTNISRNPRKTGAYKHRAFDRVIKQLQEAA